MPTGVSSLRCQATLRWRCHRRHRGLYWIDSRVGGGFINVPQMRLLMRLPTRVAAATSIFVLGTTASAGLIVYYRAGNVAAVLVGPLLVGSTRRGRWWRNCGPTSCGLDSLASRIPAWCTRHLHRLERVCPLIGSRRAQPDSTNSTESLLEAGAQQLLLPSVGAQWSSRHLALYFCSPETAPCRLIPQHFDQGRHSGICSWCLP